MQSKVIFGTSVIILQLLLFSKSHGFLNDICSIDSSLEKYCEGKHPVQNIYHPTDYHLNTATNNNTVQLHVDVRKERQLKTPQAKDGRAAINAEFMAGTTARPWLTKMDSPKSRNFERAVLDRRVLNEKTDRRVVNLNERNQRRVVENNELNLRRSIRTLNFRDARQTNNLPNRNLNVRSQDQERNSRFNSRTIRFHEETLENRRISSQERQIRHQEYVSPSNSRLDIRRIEQYNERSLPSRRSAITRNLQNHQVRIDTEQERVTSPTSRLTRRSIQFQERNSEIRRSVPTQERRQIRVASDKERILSPDSRLNTRQLFQIHERSFQNQIRDTTQRSTVSDSRLGKIIQSRERSTERNSFERNQLRTSGNRRITDLNNDRLVRESRLKRTANEQNSSERNQLRTSRNQENRITGRRSNDKFVQESRLSQNTNERISSATHQLRTSANQERRNTNRNSNDRRSIRNILNSERRNTLERSSSDREARITEPISRRLVERSVNTREISEQAIQQDFEERRVQNSVRDSRIIDQSTERNSRTTERSEQRQQPRSDHRSMDTPERRQIQNRMPDDIQSRRNSERDSSSLERIGKRQQNQNTRTSIATPERRHVQTRSVERQSRQNTERDSKISDRSLERLSVQRQQTQGNRRSMSQVQRQTRHTVERQIQNEERDSRTTERTISGDRRQTFVRLSGDRNRDTQDRKNIARITDRSLERVKQTSVFQTFRVSEGRVIRDNQINNRRNNEKYINKKDSRLNANKEREDRTLIQSKRQPADSIERRQTAERVSIDSRVRTDRRTNARAVISSRRVLINERSTERKLDDHQIRRSSDWDSRIGLVRNTRSAEQSLHNERLTTDRDSRTRATQQRIISLERNSITRSIPNTIRAINNDRIANERVPFARDSSDTSTDRESRIRITEQRSTSPDKDTRTRSFRNIRSLERTTTSNRFVDERLSSDRVSRDTRTGQESRTRTTEQRIVSLVRNSRIRSFRNIRSLERTTNNNRFADERLSSDQDSRDTRTDREFRTRTTEQSFVSLERDTRTRSVRNARFVERAANRNTNVNQRLSSDRDSRDSQTTDRTSRIRTEPLSNKIVDSRRMLHNSDRNLDSRIETQGRTLLNKHTREATSPNRRVNTRIVDSHERSIGQLDKYLAIRERLPNSRIHLGSRNLQRRVRDFSERVLNERLQNVERDSTRTDSQIRELRVRNRNLNNARILNKNVNDRRNIREVSQRAFSDSRRNVEEREFLILTRSIHKVQDLEVGIEDTWALQAIKILLVGLLLMQITRNKSKDIKIFRSFRMPLFATMKQKVQ